MREFLFRGQTRKKGERVYVGTGKPVDGNWVYGGIFQGQGDFSIIYSYEPIEKHTVYSDTVGQYTGLTDKNGKKIFEGDIVKATGTNDHIGYVEFECGKFITRCTCHPKSVCDIHPSIEEIIGNIHDNKELLGE